MNFMIQRKKSFQIKDDEYQTEIFRLAELHRTALFINDINAQLELAEAYQSGKIVQKSEKVSHFWLRRAFANKKNY